MDVLYNLYLQLTKPQKLTGQKLINVSNISKSPLLSCIFLNCSKSLANMINANMCCFIFSHFSFCAAPFSSSLWWLICMHDSALGLILTVSNAVIRKSLHTKPSKYNNSHLTHLSCVCVWFYCTTYPTFHMTYPVYTIIIIRLPPQSLIKQCYIQFGISNQFYNIIFITSNFLSSQVFHVTYHTRVPLYYSFPTHLMITLFLLLKKRFLNI